MRSFASGLLPAASVVVSSAGSRPRSFAGAWLTAALFLGLLAANRWIARWWCRALCPLGALLGLAARSAIFRIQVDGERCNDCHRCVRDCQGADEPFARHRVSECHVCLNCVVVCPEDAIRYRAFAPAAAPGGRRRPAAAAAGRRRARGRGALPAAARDVGRGEPRGDPAAGRAAEDAFLARCVRCGACVNACPTSGLQPSLTTAGLEGLYTPVLVPRHGWCEPSCTRCGQVCPTGAIAPLTPETKGWTRSASATTAPPRVKIGTAFFDWGRCLPWAMATPCVVCEEVCPTSPKAITLESVEVTRADGRVLRVGRPRMDPDRCVGCGLCEAKCPVAAPAAVRVTRAGESRDTRGGFTLGRLS